MLRIAKMVVAVVFVGCIVLVPRAQPAAADTDVCVGTAVMTTSAPFFYPGIGGPTWAWFTWNISLGTCASKFTMAMTGMMTGWCGLSTGTGVTTNGHRFSWVEAGQATFTGELEGTANLLPDIFAGQSCLPGATRFIMNFAFEKRHCANKNSSQTNVGPLIIWNKLCF